MACNKSFTMEEKRRLMELCKDGAAKARERDLSGRPLTDAELLAGMIRVYRVEELDSDTSESE